MSPTTFTETLACLSSYSFTSRLNSPSSCVEPAQPTHAVIVVVLCADRDAPELVVAAASAAAAASTAARTIAVATRFIRTSLLGSRRTAAARLLQLGVDLLVDLRQAVVQLSAVARPPFRGEAPGQVLVRRTGRGD